MINSPIPGQSLTSAPGTYPYERPPEINDPEDAIQMHLERLNSEDKIADILDTLELGVTVEMLTTGLLRSAVAEGIHSIDVSLIIAPVVHEFIKSTADEAGIEYDEGLVDEEEMKKKKSSIVAAKASRLVEKGLPESEEEPMVEEEVTREAPPSLMMRRE